MDFDEFFAKAERLGEKLALFEEYSEFHAETGRKIQTLRAAKVIDVDRAKSLLAEIRERIERQSEQLRHDFPNGVP
jgi:hypothetical protein